MKTAMDKLADFEAFKRRLAEEARRSALNGYIMSRIEQREMRSDYWVGKAL